MKWKYSKIKVLCHFFIFLCAIENEKLKHTGQKNNITQHSNKFDEPENFFFLFASICLRIKTYSLLCRFVLLQLLHFHFELFFILFCLISYWGFFMNIFLSDEIWMKTDVKLQKSNLVNRDKSNKICLVLNCSFVLIYDEIWVV